MKRGPIPFPILFGARMKQLREESGLPTREVAERADIVRTHPNVLERGASFPSVQLLQTIASLYRVDPADFFVFPDEGQRHQLRELARILTRDELAVVFAAIEKALGHPVEELIALATFKKDAAQKTASLRARAK